MAEGLWWLVACGCESPPLEVTLKGPLDLLDGRDACSAHTSHYGTRKWLVRHDPDILSIGNGGERLWVTGPGDPERVELGAGGNAEASAESCGQTRKAAGFWSS